MTSFVRFYKYIVIAYLFILGMTILVLILNERMYGANMNGQIFYLNNINFLDFKEKYKKLYKSSTTDSMECFVFHEPFHGEYKKIEYMSKDYMVPKSLKKRGATDSKDYFRSVYCRYPISSIDGYVKFYVTDEKSIKVKLHEYNPSYSANDSNQWKNYFAINGRRAPYDKNKETISAFEKEVLSKIAPYERDNIQGYIQKYVSFFEKYFLYYVGITIVLLILLTIRFLIRKIGTKSHRGDF